MAWMLLEDGMRDHQPRLRPHLHAVFISCLFAIGLLPSGALGQTGSVTAQRTHDQVAISHVTTRSDMLSQLNSQPHLKKHVDRITRFRELLKESRQGDPSPGSKASSVHDSRTADEPVIPISTPVDETDAKDLAILELEMSISARQGPSTFYPGAGLMLALQQISNWSNRHMIDALRNGGRPIYSNRGHLIGVEDPASGQLLGGRKS